MDADIFTLTHLFSLAIYLGDQLDIFRYRGHPERLEGNGYGDFDVNGLFFTRSDKRFHGTWFDMASSSRLTLLAILSYHSEMFSGEVFIFGAG